jgi:hypothetical protein
MGARAPTRGATPSDQGTCCHDLTVATVTEPRRRCATTEKQLRTVLDDDHVAVWIVQVLLTWRVVGVVVIGKDDGAREHGVYRRIEAEVVLTPESLILERKPIGSRISKSSPWRHAPRWVCGPSKPGVTVQVPRTGSSTRGVGCEPKRAAASEQTPDCAQR